MRLVIKKGKWSSERWRNLSKSGATDRGGSIHIPARDTTLSGEKGNPSQASNRNTVAF